MTGRTARRLALMRHSRWLMRSHPMSTVPPCLIREHNRWVNRQGRKYGFVVPGGWEYSDLWGELDRFGNVSAAGRGVSP